MVKVVVPPEVEDSLGWLMKEGGGLGWDGLVDYGVHLAISASAFVYAERPKLTADAFCRCLRRPEGQLRPRRDFGHQVGDGPARDDVSVAHCAVETPVRLLTSSARLLPRLHSTLQSLNLPGALQAVERPLGLPPSLLGIAQDVRRERGAERVRKLLDSIATLRSRTDASLNEVLDLLDQEAEEDETIRARHSSAQWRRPLSHEVNGQLIEQVELYRKTLQAAGESDAIVRQKWDMWEEKIEILGGDEVRALGGRPLFVQSGR
jgi:hypothetical protein